MAINPRPVPPPLSEKFLDSNGLVSESWGNFLNNLYRFHKNFDNSAADGTYTVGLGTTDGEITLSNGVITTVQEVS